MLLFIIPMFEAIYADLGGTLPLPTQILINVSKIMLQVLVRRSSSCRGRRASSCSAAGSTPKSGRKQWDAFKLQVPVFGALVAQDGARPLLAARCRRSSARVSPILESLDIVAETVGQRGRRRSGARHAERGEAR